MSGSSWDDDDDDDSDHWVGSDDEHDDDPDDSALDFAGPVADDDDDDDWSGLGALDAHEGPTDDDTDDTELDALDYPPVPTVADDSDVSALDHLLDAPTDEDAGPEVLLFSVTHPSRMITAKAVISGRIQRVELTPEVSRMTESQLTQAIMTTADLASLKARSAQYLFVQGLMGYQGLDNDTITTFLDEYAHLPTPAQAEAAEASVTSEFLRGNLH